MCKQYKSTLLTDLTGMRNQTLMINKYLTVENICNPVTDKPYLIRYIVFQSKFGPSFYIHKFIDSDDARDMHDHPSWFYSIGVWGCYLEEHPDGTTSKYCAPFIRVFPPTHIHRLKLVSKIAWTIVFAGFTKRSWGFWKSGIWIRWDEYLKSKTTDH